MNKNKERNKDKMRRGTIMKYSAIKKRFDHLYNVQRLRYDDCIEQLMKEFYITAKPTISTILCMDLPELPPEVDPNQINIFMAGVPDIIPQQLAATG